MAISVRVRPASEVLRQSCVVPMAPAGNSWSEGCLSDYAKKRGVYIIHQNGRVIYVGKTGGKSMSFGVRLRREFQHSAAQGRHIYPKLKKLRGEIRVSFITSEEIWDSISGLELHKDWEDQVFSLMEAVLICAYKPEFQAPAVMKAAPAQPRTP